MTWFLAVLSALLVVASFPVEGLAGAGLALAGVAMAVLSIRTNPVCKGRAK